MREPTEMIVRTEEPDAEVELSAQDLRELSEARENNEHECGLMKGPAVHPQATTAAALPSASGVQVNAPPARARHVPLLRRSLSLTFVLGAIGLYVLMASSDDAGQPLAQNVAERASQPEWPGSQPKINGDPVLFANPFDAHEVFEFPAGTSEAQARDTVAEVLMERALERQRQFDARVAENH